MGGINSMQGVNPTTINIGEDGNLKPGAEKLDLQNNSWSVWDGNDWKAVLPDPASQVTTDAAMAALKHQIMSGFDKPVESHNMDEGAQNAGGRASDGNAAALPKPVESHQI